MQQRLEHRSVASWIRWGGPLVLAISVALQVAAYVHWWPSYSLQIDTLVYRFGGVRVSEGLDLYSIGRNGGTDDLLFTYTPFAAVFFLPLAWISESVAQVVALAASVALLTYVVWRILRWFGVTRAQGLWGLTALLVGLLLWLQPIRLSIQLGQINLLILAAVVMDLLAPSRRRWAGIGIGLMAGIKLTPALFILYLFVLGRFRAAAVAVTTLVGTVLVGFAVIPSESKRYWIDRAFTNTKRIARDPSIGSSISSLFQRLGYPTVLGLVLSALLLVIGLAVAWYTHRRGQAVLAIAIVGMTSAAVSPFSWSHHWVWFAPLIVHLAYRGYVLGSRTSAVTMWGLCLVFADWLISLTGRPPSSSILKVQLGGLWNDVIPSVYVPVYLVVLVCTIVWLRRQPPAPDDPEHVNSSAPSPGVTRVPAPTDG